MTDELLLLGVLFVLIGCVIALDVIWGKKLERKRRASEFRDALRSLENKGEDEDDG